MKKKKILIVEDEFILANDLQLTLKKEEFEVAGIAASFKEAIAMIESELPDMVILDIHLKGKQTGIDVAGQLQKRNIPFIYLSANSDQQILEAAKATEPYGFLVKPFRPKDLLVTLDIAFYRHGHSLESEIRKRKQLEKQLEAINAITENKKEKLLQMALAIQPHIPFDFLSICQRSPEGQVNLANGFLRIGYQQYQEIGPQQLMVITGMKEIELNTIMAASALDEKPGWYNNDDFKAACRNIPLKRLFAKHFQLESNIAYPYSTNQGYVFSLSLFSHQEICL